jgi:hypothetical protein
MEQIPTPVQALSQIVEALGPKKREALQLAIKSLQLIVEPKQSSGPGSFWADPERGARAREAMKASWAARKPDMQVTWRTSGEQRIVKGYDELPKLVGRAEMTIRIAISKGRGVAYFMHNDDVITVQRL